MHIADKIRHWGDEHHPKILDVIRILLGIFLFAKGLSFFNNSGYLRELIIENRAIRQSPGTIMALINYVTYIHLVGGALIFLGLYTRLWAVLQLPVVFGAVFFVNVLSPFVNSDLWLSILVLALLFLFMIIGSGPLSLDYLLSRYKTEETEHRNRSKQAQ